MACEPIPAPVGRRRICAVNSEPVGGEFPQGGFTPPEEAKGGSPPGVAGWGDRQECR